ncbi:MAG: hypothetical protein C0442_01525 [Chlorobiaceae bacterium]|nr:hypothetical protein [Chlorobiaceae bacterium]
MKTYLLRIIILFLVATNYNFSQPLFPDFRVCRDNTPSTIIQNNPKIFVNEPHGFLITWTDYLEGDGAISAQHFDPLGNKVGANFKIFGDEDIVFKDELSFLSVQALNFYNQLSGEGSINYVGRIVNRRSILNNSLNLAHGTLPWCGTGWLGISYSILYHKNIFRSYISDGGRVFLRELDSAGLLLNEEQLRINSAAWVNAEKLKDNDHALFWFKAFSDSTPIGLHGNFYSANNQTYVENKFIVTDSTWIQRGWVTANFVPLMRIKQVSDSLYQFFWIRYNPLNLTQHILSYCQIDRRGNRVGEIVSIPISKQNLVPFYLNYTNSFNNKFSVLLASRKTSPRLEVFNEIYDFHNDGTFTGNSKADTSLHFRFNEDIYKLDDEKFIVSATDDKDIYRAVMRNFVLSDLVKVNDDLTGSNESSPAIITKNENTNLILWRDEISTRGRFINSNGNFVGDEKVIGAAGVQFLSDGTAIGIWINQIEENKFNTGFIYYDNQFNEVRRDTFTYANIAARIESGQITFRLLNDTSIVVLYRIDNQIRARLLDVRGNQKKDIFLQTQTWGFRFGIYLHDRNNFYLTWNGMLQLYDNNLNVTSPLSSGSIDVYLGNHKYFSFRLIRRDFMTSFHEGFIFSTAGDTIRKNIRLVDGAEHFSAFPIDENSFLTVYQISGKTYARAFNIDLTPLKPHVIIHDNSLGKKRQFFTLENSGKTYFAWSDNRNGNYDIFSNIFETNILTSINDIQTEIIPDKFTLFQNYPNPFNPITKIKYVIPSGVSNSRTADLHVTLKIYDVLGREVATLVDEIKSPGLYTVDFSIADLNLSSGVFFYKLFANKSNDEQFVETKKMILLK